MINLQFISHFTEKYDYADSIRIALKGGCRWVQLRMKDATDDELERVAKEVLPLCRAMGATFFIDDNVMLAKKVGADGVHLGHDDMPVDEARRILGSNFIIGGTANTLDDVTRLWRQGADYIGCGPFRFTQTKKKLSPVLGEEGYRTIVRQMKEQGINIPIVAIGGICRTDIHAIMSTGVTGIALSGSILRADDPVAEMREVVKTMEQEIATT